MTYAIKLKDPRWQKLRLQVLQRDNFTCQLCGDTKTELHIHHFCYNKSGNPWDSTDDSLITYCKHCHAIKEYSKKSDLKEYPYKIIKLSIVEELVSIAAFYLSYNNVFDLFCYNEKTDKLTFLTCLPRDFIESIHKYFIKTNSILNGKPIS